VHPRKQFEPNVVTEFGIKLKVSNPVQLAKQLLPNDVTDDGPSNVILPGVKFKQPLKQLVPIVETKLGIVILFIPQLKKH
jgi:hypothetical protein